MYFCLLLLMSESVRFWRDFQIADSWWYQIADVISSYFDYFYFKYTQRKLQSRTNYCPYCMAFHVFLYCFNKEYATLWRQVYTKNVFCFFIKEALCTCNTTCVTRVWDTLFRFSVRMFWYYTLLLKNTWSSGDKLLR